MNRLFYICETMDSEARVWYAVCNALDPTQISSEGVPNIPEVTCKYNGGVIYY